MNTDQKGSIGLAKVLIDLTQKGFECYLPWQHSTATDLIVRKDGKCATVQVKYRHQVEECIVVMLRRMTLGNGKRKYHNSKDGMDVLAIYCPETDKCYYVKTSEVGSSITLRFGKPKIMTKMIRMADSYAELSL